MKPKHLDATVHTDDGVRKLSRVAPYYGDARWVTFCDGDSGVIRAQFAAGSVRRVEWAPSAETPEDVAAERDRLANKIEAASKELYEAQGSLFGYVRCHKIGLALKILS